MHPAGGLLDGFQRVNEALHRQLGDLSLEELTCEPHPPIGWLAWRLTRVADSNIARQSGQDQLWIASWAARFKMEPDPADFGRGQTHTREQVRAFDPQGPDLLLAYQDATWECTKSYLEKLTAADLDQELNEPQFTPLPTLAVRLMSVLENGMQNAGQIAYLKALHRIGGWFPAELRVQS